MISRYLEFQKISCLRFRYPVGISFLSFLQQQIPVGHSLARACILATGPATSRNQYDCNRALKEWGPSSQRGFIPRSQGPSQAPRAGFAELQVCPKWASSAEATGPAGWAAARRHRAHTIPQRQQDLKRPDYAGACQKKAVKRGVGIGLRLQGLGVCGGPPLGAAGRVL